MDIITKLERKIAGYLKDLPHLPHSMRLWLAENIWWIVAFFAVVCGISAIALVIRTLVGISTLGGPQTTYYAQESIASWVIIKNTINLVFAAGGALLLGAAVNPLKERQKKGWVLLFVAWCVGVIASVVSVVLLLDFFEILSSLIFTVIWVVITAYFIFEIHGEFAHVERSKGAKKASSKK